MKRLSVLLTICCILSLFLSACSDPEQSQTQSSSYMETTENNASNRAILMQYNFIVQEPLAGSEPEDVARQSRFLQDAGIEGMTAELRIRLQIILFAVNGCS